MLREATRSSIPQTNLTIDFRMRIFLLHVIIHLLLYLLVVPPKCRTRWKRWLHDSPRCRPSIVAKPTTLSQPDKMPKKRGKRSSTANGGTPGGTRARKGKKTQKKRQLSDGFRRGAQLFARCCFDARSVLRKR